VRIFLNFNETCELILDSPASLPNIHNKCNNSGKQYSKPTTMNEFYNAQITTLAVTTQRAADNTYQHGLVAKALSDQRESVAGVSLDEEAANMAKAQKAYQAAARMLTAFDDLLDLIINRMGRAGI